MRKVTNNLTRRNTWLKTLFCTILFLVIIFSFQRCNSGSGSGTSYSNSARNNTEYDQQQAVSAIKEIISGEQWEKEFSTRLISEKARDTIVQLVNDFYQKKNFVPQWNQSKMGAATENFLNELSSLKTYGLNPSDFPVEKLREELENVYYEDKVDYESLAKTEIALTANYFLLARQVGKGRIKPGKYLDNWFIHPEEVNKVRNLEYAFKDGIEDALSKLEPDYRQYALLKEKLEGYIEIAETGGWKQVTLNAAVNPGDSAKVVTEIRKRIYAETRAGGDLENAVYDKDLQEELQEFRLRYGLPTDKNVIDEELVTALNVPVEERIKKLNLNLERCRWLTEPMGEKYIIVNIPEYRVRVVEKGSPVLDMKVIVGKEVNKTPVFSDSLEYLEFAPYWNVPVSIATEEILPRAKEDPMYLENRHYEIVDGWGDNDPVISVSEINWATVDTENFPYRIRQKPGHWNALGKVKFMFPNNKAIYLHDTPADHLFSESERQFSHGCIRVEHPDELANYLLPDYSERKIKDLMNSSERTVVPLEEKIPVYLVYFTTIVDSEGRLRFLDDIYEIDVVQGQAL